MPTLIHDIDDTIFNCADILQAYLEDEHGLVAEQRLRDTHDIPKLYDIDLPTTLDLIRKFHRSDRMERMEAYPCAATVLPELHRAGYRFVAITACLNEPEVIEARRRNLEGVFGFEWEAIHCIGLSPCKKDALMAYPASIWVDDLAHHAAAGAEAGHRSFLIDKLYNQDADHPEVTRVIDWHDLMRHL